MAPVMKRSVWYNLRIWEALLSDLIYHGERPIDDPLYPYNLLPPSPESTLELFADDLPLELFTLLEQWLEYKSGFEKETVKGFNLDLIKNLFALKIFGLVDFNDCDNILKESIERCRSQIHVYIMSLLVAFSEEALKPLSKPSRYRELFQKYHQKMYETFTFAIRRVVLYVCTSCRKNLGSDNMLYHEKSVERPMEVRIRNFHHCTDILVSGQLNHEESKSIEEFRDLYASIGDMSRNPAGFLHRELLYSLNKHLSLCITSIKQGLVSGLVSNGLYTINRRLKTDYNDPNELLLILESSGLDDRHWSTGSARDIERIHRTSSISIPKSAYLLLQLDRSFETDMVPLTSIIENYCDNGSDQLQHLKLAWIENVDKLPSTLYVGAQYLTVEAMDTIVKEHSEIFKEIKSLRTKVVYQALIGILESIKEMIKKMQMDDDVRRKFGLHIDAISKYNEGCKRSYGDSTKSSPSQSEQNLKQSRIFTTLQLVAKYDLEKNPRDEKMYMTTLEYILERIHLFLPQTYAVSYTLPILIPNVLKLFWEDIQNTKHLAHLHEKQKVARNWVRSILNLPPDASSPAGKKPQFKLNPQSTSFMPTTLPIRAHTTSNMSARQSGPQQSNYATGNTHSQGPATARPNDYERQQSKWRPNEGILPSGQSKSKPIESGNTSDLPETGLPAHTGFFQLNQDKPPPWNLPVQK